MAHEQRLELKSLFWATVSFTDIEDVAKAVDQLIRIADTGKLNELIGKRGGTPLPEEEEDS